MNNITIDPKHTALVLIDLQRGVVSMPTQPHPPAVVLQNSIRLAERFRELKSPVFLVHVAFSADGRDMLQPEADAPYKSGPRQPDWMELVPEIGPREGDIVITKRQWGAFYGTQLELQLRRRDVRTIVLGGIATNIGVESTARDAFERGYNQIFVEDAMSSLSAEAHDFAVKTILPRIGRIRSTDDVLSALTA